VNVGNSVRKAIDDWQVDQIEAAMLHACAAVDGTAKKANPSESSSKRRFTRFLRNNYHILGPMGASGLEIQNQRFPVRLDSPSTTPDGLPDFADVIYVVHRNPQAHGDELLPGFELMPDAAYLPGHTSVLIEPGKVRLSDRVIFGLIAVAVMSLTMTRGFLMATTSRTARGLGSS
jgi:hypothetical protein